jgi:hypothetical protein
VQQDKRMKRAPKEKECRARRLSGSSSNSGAERLVQLSAARARDNQTAGGSDNQKKRHRQDRDNFIATKRAAPDEKHRSRFGLNAKL